MMLSLTAWGEVFAQSPGHIGDYCLPCHKKFSFEQPNATNFQATVKNPDVLRYEPCNSELCHRSNPEVYGAVIVDRHLLHLKEAICKNCHRTLPGSGEFDIHTIHQKFEELNLNRTPVECKLCHSVSEGFVSSIANVPLLKEKYRTVGNYRILPWGGKCEYCHPSVEGAGTLHDVHKPVIKNACPECHGDKIKSRNDLISRIAMEQPQKIEEEGYIIQMFSRIFDEMSKRVLNFVTQIVSKVL